MRRKKGFTLIELTIVLAILAILVAILVPSWGYYLQRSRIKAQNNKARVVFNAAQNIITDLQFSERMYLSNYDELTTDADKAKVVPNFYTPNPAHTDKISDTVTNEWFFYYDGHSGTISDVAGEVDYSTRTAIANKWNDKLTNSINNIAGDDAVYRVYVRDYTVLAVVSARSTTDQYLGSYPITLDKRRMDDEINRTQVDRIRAKHIDGLTLDDIKLMAY